MKAAEICYFPVSPIGQPFTRLVHVSISILALLFVAFVTKVIGKCKPSTKEMFTSVLFSFAFLFAPLVQRVCLEYYNCVTVAGVPVMLSNGEVCYEGAHLIVLTIVSIIIVTLLIGFPVYLSRVMRNLQLRVKTEIENGNTSGKFGRLDLEDLNMPVVYRKFYRGIRPGMRTTYYALFWARRSFSSVLYVFAGSDWSKVLSLSTFWGGCLVFHIYYPPFVYAKELVLQEVIFVCVITVGLITVTEHLLVIDATVTVSTFYLLDSLRYFVMILPILWVAASKVLPNLCRDYMADLWNGDEDESSSKRKFTRSSIHLGENSSLLENVKDCGSSEISIVVEKATAVPAVDVASSDSDPYVRIIINKCKKKTQVVRNQSNPVWNEKLTFQNVCLDDEITIQLFDFNKYTRKTPICLPICSTVYALVSRSKDEPIVVVQGKLTSEGKQPDCCLFLHVEENLSWPSSWTKTLEPNAPLETETEVELKQVVVAPAPKMLNSQVSTGVTKLGNLLKLLNSSGLLPNAVTKRKYDACQKLRRAYLKLQDAKPSQLQLTKLLQFQRTVLTLLYCFDAPNSTVIEAYQVAIDVLLGIHENKVASSVQNDKDVIVMFLTALAYMGFGKLLSKPTNASKQDLDASYQLFSKAADLYVKLSPKKGVSDEQDQQNNSWQLFKAEAQMYETSALIRLGEVDKAEQLRKENEKIQMEAFGRKVLTSDEEWFRAALKKSQENPKSPNISVTDVIADVKQRLGTSADLEDGLSQNRQMTLRLVSPHPQTTKTSSHPSPQPASTPSYYDALLQAHATRGKSQQANFGHLGGAATAHRSNYMHQPQPHPEFHSSPNLSFSRAGTTGINKRLSSHKTGATPGFSPVNEPKYISYFPPPNNKEKTVVSASTLDEAADFWIQEALRDDNLEAFDIDIGPGPILRQMQGLAPRGHAHRR
eukprot:CAMPEP_0175167496 /NCGR_PEP_ID=MMETSP0087-20121206/28383_1 /TAXON_ID=136419 /ORGANISM="Unknown Unknown, Strain D1" /LENGTH=933 /DNA_ID=CAMNT_0016457409 /DNA_START=239 /DNA_END=3040 /DNA_ORIENTATION=-